MKRILVLMLLIAIPVMAYDFNKLIIGKWDMVNLDGNIKTRQIVFDKTTSVMVESNQMDTENYFIKNDQLCFKEVGKVECDKMVWASQDEFYLVDNKIKFLRVKE